MTIAARQEAERAATQAAKARATREFVKKSAFVIAGLLAFSVVWWVCELFRIPAARGFDAALLPTPGKLIVVLVATVLAGAIGGLIVGRFHFDGGVACAAVGLLAVSTRGGRMQDLLLVHQTPNIYLTLAVETAILFGGIFGIWVLLTALRRRGVVRDAFVTSDGSTEAFGQKLLASGAHLLIMGALMTVACQSDDKLQVWVTLLLSGYVAARAAYAFVPADDGIFFWPVPVVLAIVGYVAAYMDADKSMASPLAIGQVSGALAGLARPLPVDWASMGVIGSLVGFWAARERKIEGIPTTRATPASVAPDATAGAIEGGIRSGR